nr:reverse transcriptase domain-containing protein [Tanacetum cinerariifolium]
FPGHAPPSLDYVPGPEHPSSPDYVPGSEEPEQAPLSLDDVPKPGRHDDDESFGYDVDDEDEKASKDEDDDDDEEEEHLALADSSDVPAVHHVLSAEDTEAFKTDKSAPTPPSPRPRRDRISIRPRDDDDDDEDEEEEHEAFKDDNEEEEEHLAPVDSSTVPAVDPVSLAEDTEAFEIDESAPTSPGSPRLHRARISVRLPPFMAASIEARIVEYAVAPTLPLPPSSLLTPLSSLLPQFPSPSLLSPSLPITSPTYAEAPLGYKAAEIWLRVASPSTHHPSEIPSPPLLLLSTSHKDDISEVDMPRQKKARFTIPAFRFEVGESSVAATSRQPRLDVATMDATPGCLVSKKDGYGIKDKMPPKRTVTKTTPAPMTDAQIKALIAQGVADALAELEANKTSRNGDDSHDLGTGSRRTKQAAREMFLEESEQVEKYVDGLLDMIQRSVMASKPKKIQDAIEFATELMDQKIRSLVDHQAENKRKNGGAIAKAYVVETARTNLNSNVVTGLAGYYRRFIEGFLKIAKSMTKQTQKMVKFDWGDKQGAAFQLLKEKLCSAPILALPEGDKNFIVYCDASHKGLGTVLMQNEKKELNMRQHRWLEFLSDYDCEIRYYPRKTNVVADALRRKERIMPLRIRALVMTIGLDLPKKVLEAQTEARKPKTSRLKM